MEVAVCFESVLRNQHKFCSRRPPVSVASRHLGVSSLLGDSYGLKIRLHSLPVRQLQRGRFCVRCSSTADASRDSCMPLPTLYELLEIPQHVCQRSKWRTGRWRVDITQTCARQPKGKSAQGASCKCKKRMTHYPILIYVQITTFGCRTPSTRGLFRLVLEQEIVGEQENQTWMRILIGRITGNHNCKGFGVEEREVGNRNPGHLRCERDVKLSRFHVRYPSYLCAR